MSAPGDLANKNAMESTIGNNSTIDVKADSSALVMAVHRGQMNVVERLLNAGAPIDAVDQFGQTTCHAAADRGDADVLAVLLRRRPALGLPRCRATLARLEAFVSTQFRQKRTSTSRRSSSFRPQRAAVRLRRHPAAPSRVAATSAILMTKNHQVRCAICQLKGKDEEIRKSKQSGFTIQECAASTLLCYKHP
jgi:ankyrin repeat protein